MSRLHAVLLTLGFVVLYVVPVSLAVIFGPFFFVPLFCSVMITYIAVTVAADEGFYVIPATYELRALNRKHKCNSQARYLRFGAQRCRELAKNYEGRKQFDEAAVLEVEAEHREREADLCLEQSKDIQRETENRELKNLTRGA